MIAALEKEVQVAARATQEDQEKVCILECEHGKPIL